MKNNVLSRKILTIAVLASLAMFGTTSQIKAEEVANPTYTIKEGSEIDYTFTTTDGENVIYHKIELSQNLSTSESVTWEEVAEEGANTIKVQLPHNGDSARPEIKYFKYTYTTPTGYTTATGHVTDLSSANVNGVLFKTLSSTINGGAIINTKDKSNVDILADFIGNYASSSDDIYGGAIFNYGVIGNITGDFIGNYTSSSSSYYSANGGAIYNYYSSATIGDITGDFIGNYASSSFYSATGGAIYNDYSGTIGNITGDFIGNYVQGSSTYGGAIYNDYATIGDITGDFIGNYAKSESDIAYGGAIYNYYYGTIGDITGDFIGNYTKSSSASAKGGVIYNCYYGTIGDITGDFIGNYVQGFYYAYGGAIDNESFGTVGDITGDFIGNYAHGFASFSIVKGGAINNVGIIGSVVGNFIGNYVQGPSSAYGGAIYSNGTIGDITGDFIGNYAESGTNPAYGGAIYNNGTVGNITGDFAGNYVKSEPETESEFSNAYGGAICNSEGEIGDITGDFSNNFAQSSSVGTLAQGGAIYNGYGTIGSKNSDGDIVGGIINSSFIGNYAKSEKGIASGGAIYASYSDLNIVAKDDYVSIFKDNYTESAGVKEDNAIALDNAKLNFQMINGGKFVMNDNITAVHVDVQDLLKDYGVSSLEEYAVVVDGFKNTALETFLDWNGCSSIEEFVEEDGYSSLEELLADYGYETFEEFLKDEGFYGETPLEQLFYSYGVESEDEFLREMGYGPSTVTIQGDDINNTVFYLYNDINKAHVNIGNTTLNTINNIPHNYNFHSFTLTAPINMAVDVDLANRTMDRITADAYGEHTGTLNVSAMNLLSDAKTDKTEIPFAEAGLKDNVTTTVSEVAYSPIYKYNVSYDKSGEKGMFVFVRPTTSGGTASTGNSSDAFNPAILGASTSATVGAVGTVNQAVNHSFNSVDAYMNVPALERMAMKRRNHYALADVPDDVRQLGKYSPLYLPGDEEESVWVKPYSVFESIPLKNGPKVSNISYGTLVGFDSPMVSLRRGWDRVISGYVGYNGASQRFAGVDSVQNGGLLGGTLTMYKGNFFNATTLNVGASVAQNETMYGKDDYTILMSGVANKTGYNIEFKDGKVILQPSMLVGYTFVNTFDYTNAAGVKIDNKPLHTIQLSPSVKLIGNLKDGWQPYASVGMVWNVMGKSDATANGVKLPEMEVKPYVQYGVGLQKRVKDHFMAYGQAMIQNGGRNGISLTAGIRWALGHKDSCDYEIKEIKSDKKAVKVKKDKKAETNAECKEIKKTEIKKTEIKVKKVVKKDTNVFKLSSKTVK